LGVIGFASFMSKIALNTVLQTSLAHNDQVAHDKPVTEAPTEGAKAVGSSTVLGHMWGDPWQYTGPNKPLPPSY